MQGPVTDPQTRLSQALKRLAAEEGFNPVGIADPESTAATAHRSPGAGWTVAIRPTWPDGGPRRQIPGLLDGAQSVLAVVLKYYVNGQPRLRKIARYGWDEITTELWISDCDGSVAGSRNGSPTAAGAPVLIQHRCWTRPGPGRPDWLIGKNTI